MHGSQVYRKLPSLTSTNLTRTWRPSKPTETQLRDFKRRKTSWRLTRVTRSLGSWLPETQLRDFKRRKTSWRLTRVTRSLGSWLLQRLIPLKKEEEEEKEKEKEKEREEKKKNKNKSEHLRTKVTEPNQEWCSPQQS